MRDTTKLLIEGIGLDLFPTLGAQTDFGFDPMACRGSQREQVQRFGALQYAFKMRADTLGRDATVRLLDEALGDGGKLTDFITMPKQPYPCTITTVWDEIKELEEAIEGAS